MTKKERIEYYVLVEPKLREIFINNGFAPPSEEEFQKLNLTKKNREEFLAHFKDRWFNIKHFSSDKSALEMEEADKKTEEILGVQALKNIQGSKSNLPKLELPSDFALFQISKNIDIKRFHFHLIHRDTFIVVHKKTGAVAGGSTLSTVSISFKNLLEIIKKDATQFEIFEIEDHNLFCKLLENGDFKKIKNEKLFEMEYFEVPADYPLSTILKQIDLYEFAESLNKGKPLFKYDLRTGWYTAYENVNEYHAFNATYNDILELDGFKPIDRSKETDSVWFYTENPRQIRQEMIFGNFKILKKIKVIKNIYTFSPSNNG